MPTPSAEEILLDRYRQKCLMAGGPRPGFVLRRRALLYTQPEHPGVDLAAGITTIEEKGLIKASESGDFLFLTAAGVEAIGGTPGAPD